VVELVDTLALGASALGRGGSSPLIRTIKVFADLCCNVSVMAKIQQKHKRNGALFDRWSIVHLCTGIVFGWVMPPFIALALMVLWEPLEILVLSPFLGRHGIVFGYETLNNSLSDIFFDVVGVSLGAITVTAIAAPPLHLF
jgi:hypothetical protein